MMNNHYFITTPYIDAWTDGKEVSLSIFRTLMRGQAYEWGEQGLGRALLRGHDPAMLGDRYVLAIGIRNDTHYAAVYNGEWSQPEIVKMDWPEEWDVT